MPIEKCKCGKTRNVNVGDCIRDGKYSWYMSSHCEYCGETFEMDGYDIFDIPYDIEQEIIKRDGEWGIIAKGSVAKINFSLKKILNNEYHIENVHKGNVIYTGTQEQVKWVKDRLIGKGISEKELEIKLLTPMNCDCNERIGTKINSWKQFEELKEFFEGQIKKGLFIDIPVKKPYYIGYSADGKAMKWYADKWYKCLACGVLWEFKYPDFPAQGSVRKLNADE